MLLVCSYLVPNTCLVQLIVHALVCVFRSRRFLTGLGAKAVEANTVSNERASGQSQVAACGDVEGA